jgi:HEAT repeat protein
MLGIDDALAVAIAKAIATYAAQSAVPGMVEKLRARLGRAPEQRALKESLVAAASEFRRSHPDWADALFDEHFLTHRAAPVLARCLSATHQPTGEDLAAAYESQFAQLGEADRPHSESGLVGAAEGFLSDFQAALRTHDEFRAALDSAALDQTAKNTALLVDTVQGIRVWLESLLWLLGQAGMDHDTAASADAIKSRLSWLADAHVRDGFSTAFTKAVVDFQRDHEDSVVGQAVLSAMADLTEDPDREVDRGMLVEVALRQDAEEMDVAGIAERWKSRSSAAIDVEPLSQALLEFAREYLRPALRAEPTFPPQEEFNALLDDIRRVREERGYDLTRLDRDYRKLIASRYELLTMKGISPKVGSREIGIHMSEVFIPVRGTIGAGDLARWSAERTWRLPTWRAIQQATLTWQDLGQSTLTWRDLEQSTLTLSSSDAIRPLDVLPFLQFASNEVTLTVPPTIPLARFVTATPYPSNFTINMALPPGSGKSLWTSVMMDYVNVDLSALTRLNRVVILGDPGAGKSTITRFLAWVSATGSDERVDSSLVRRVPLRIRAIEFGEAVAAGNVTTLDEYLVETVGRFGPLARHALLSCSALVLLDGLDEVGAAVRSRVMDRVNDFLADPLFGENQIVMTSRIVGFDPEGPLAGCPRVRLRDLDDEQIADFLTRWYGAISRALPGSVAVEDERDRLIKVLSDNAGIGRMARNPLLLTIIALLKWQGRDLPDQRVLLYDAAFQTLVSTWPRTQRHVELDDLFIREWLAPVAMAIVSDPESDVIDEPALMDLLVSSMKELKALANQDARRASRDLLTDVEQHSGVLVARGQDRDGREVYGFLHQTFAEYLTAYLLAGRWEDGDLPIGQYAHAASWREVLFLVAGHLGIQRRAKAGRLVAALRTLRTPFEASIHRDLLLACSVLADGVPVAPADLVAEIVSEALHAWATTRIHAFQRDAEAILARLRTTEYGQVSGRLAAEMKLGASDVVSLAAVVGPEYLSDELRDVASGENPMLVIRACGILSEVDPDAANGFACQLLDSPSENARVLAARWLRARVPERALAAAVDLLESPSWETRVAAIPIFGSEDASALVELLKDRKGAVRRAAARRLLSFESLAPLGHVEGIVRGDDRAESRVLALRVLCHHAPEDLSDVLNSLAASGETRVILGAVRGQPACVNRSDVRACLVSLMDDENANVRVRAAIAILRADPGDGRALKVTADALSSEDDDLRVAAAIAAGKVGDARALAALADMAVNGPRSVQALEALAVAEPSSAESVALRVIKDGSPEVKAIAAEILVEGGNEAGVRPLLEVLRDGQVGAAARAGHVLERSGMLRGRVAELAPVLAEARAAGRRAAVALLDNSESSFQLAVTLVNDEDAAVRERAVNHLISAPDEKWHLAIEARAEQLLRDTERAGRGPTARSVADVIYAFLCRDDASPVK